MKRHCFALAAFAFLCGAVVVAQTPTEFPADGELVHCVAFSSDGTLLATSSGDDNAAIWDFATGKESQILKGHKGRVNSIAFNKAGTIVATAGADGTIRLWNPKDGKTIKDCGKAHPEGALCVAFSPDGSLLASCGADKTVRLWDGKEGKELKNLGAHKQSAYCVAFNPAGTEIVSCSGDGIIKIWDVKGQKEIKSMMVDLPEPAVKIQPKKEEPKKDAKDKTEKKKDMGKKDETKARDAIHVVAFTPDGKQILSGGWDRYLRYWSVADGKETKKIGPKDMSKESDIMGLAVSRDGKNVATAGYGGMIHIYDIATGREVFTKHLQYWITYGVVFAPDGRSVVTANQKAGKGIAKVTPIMK